MIVGSLYDSPDKTSGDNALGTTKNTINDIKISHVQNGNTLVINNKSLDVTVRKSNIIQYSWSIYSYLES